MEAGSTRPREQPIAVPDSDSAEQEEPQHSLPEITTMAGNTKDNTNRTESQPIASPQTEEAATIERIEPVEPGPTTQNEDDAMENPTTAEREQDAQQSNEAPTDTTPCTDQNIRTEPNILDIFEDE